MSSTLHTAADMDMIREDLRRSTGDVRRIHELLHEAFLALLRRALAGGSAEEVPVLVLRGGLLAYRAATVVFQNPLGLVAPRGHGKFESRTYGDVPVSSRYLVIDTIANTGNTLAQCLADLSQRVPNATIRAAFLFGTAGACERLNEAKPGLDIHTVWSDFVRGEDGRLVGISYDAGDYAMMDSIGKRIAW